MTNTLQVFENEEFGQVRTVVIDNEPWFVGKDVAQILGYRNPNEAIQDHVDCEDKFIRSERGSEMLKLFSSLKEMLKTLGRQDNWFINESGLYSLILSSKLPSAKKFKHWVTAEVLPSIRKNGGYIAGQETLSDAELMAKALLVAQRTIENKNKQITEMKPKAEFYDTVANSESLLSIGDVAKTLDMGIGRNKLFALLRNKGILNANNIPYQRYVDAGYFALVESSFMVDVNQVVKTTTYVKQKGIDYIQKLLAKDGYTCKKFEPCKGE